ncbi:hypothetical protein BU23DRAFT_552003 [Bimuria novae-zelandiae CBS 107.79]|uniref:Zn(2)-C6 fungal-type domain-containing protein n=1 Tax=Bimuria novae-zelandiae CBS 107.79 TaxID=1447943 RepID=A0A6A5VLU8_9PLEO|nr:hypothetical protein BU23DRAFT_552003 [Bimuria novae-zelandiae CBS 107.79]
MARGAIKGEDGAGPAGEPKASKRRCVQSACVPCRKRKSKCDGSTPNCATCTAVYGTPCHYDTESESRRSKVGTKRDATAVTSPSSATNTSNTPANEDAEFLLTTIRTLPEADANELIHHIRRDARLDVASLADTWRKAVALRDSTPPEPQSLESELSILLGKPAMTRSGESRYYGHTSHMSLVPEDENYTCVVPRAATVARKGPTWTTITDDMAFVERLLDLYFRWSHTFYIVFSRECFYKDFRSGREKYCSPLLVNAILAYACHFTNEPAGRTDPDNFRTAGDHFFEEARRLLFENEASSLTTVQALCVMAMREPSAGRDSSGFAYMGRCMRMAIEMGLHLKNSAAPTMGLSASEIEVRKVTFWGCFTVDTIWSICIGRISQLPRVAITLDKPILDEPTGRLIPEAHSSTLQIPAGAVTSRMFLQEFSTLSELINDNNYMFYAPNGRLNDTKLISCHNKYLEWFKNLPPALRLEGVEKPQPHIMALHMLYYTAIEHLFRPMLKADLINFKLRPRDACIEAANTVSELLRQYRSHYPMRSCVLVFTHVLLSTCIIHITFLKDSSWTSSSYRYLVEGLQALEDLSVCHWFGARSFRIVYELSKTWNLGFPEEMQNSPLIPKSGTAAETSESSLVWPRLNTRLPSRTNTGAEHSPVPSSAHSNRTESLSMFARPGRKGVRLPSHPATSQPGMLRSQTKHRGSLPHILPSYSSSSTSTPQTDISTSQAHQATTDSADTLFWNPFPNMGGLGVPILPRSNYPAGPMDLDNMLGSSDEWDRLGRDGFKMSETWNHDQSNTYPGSGEQGYPQVSGVTNGYTTADVAQFGGGVPSGMNGHVSGVQHGGAQAFDASWWGGEGNLGR